MSEKYSLRKEFFNDFCNFNREMINQITFFKKKLPEIVSSFVCKNQFSLLLSEYKNYLNGEGFLLEKFWYLSMEEKDLLIAYFSLLGRSDSSSQLSNLNSYSERLKNLSKETERDEKKYKKLYIKLGFFAGLTVFVLMI